MGVFSNRLFLRSQKTADRGNAATGGGVIYQERGKVQKSSSALFRNWAEHSEWIRAAISIRKSQVSSAEFDIVPFDSTAKFDNGLRRELLSRFNLPNNNVESFRSWVEPGIEDLLVLDGFGIEKERTLGGEIYGLHATDVARIKVSAEWDGTNPRAPRYWWCPTPTIDIPLLNEDFVYVMANPRTYSVMGLSPLETLKMTIDAELNGSQYNRRQVEQAAPDGIFDLGEGARAEQVEAFQNYWRAEVAGKGALAFLGGTKNAKFIPFRQSNRDMQYDEWLKYLVLKICAVFLISPQDIGITFDINRATGDTQKELTEDQGLRPLLALLQDYFTREIVWDKSYGGPDNNLAFRFTRLNIKESMSKANINKLALAGMPWKPVNEARLDEGRQPLGDPNDPENPYNRLMANTPLGVVAIDEVASAREVTGIDQQPAPSSGESQAAKPKTYNLITDPGTTE